MGLWPGDAHFPRRYDYSTEYVTILRELWATGRSDFKGEYFRMTDCRLSPRPQADVKIVCAGQSERGLTTTVSDIEHIESQSLAGVTVIKVFFQPTANIQTAIAQTVAAMQTQVRQLPPGITPPKPSNRCRSRH